MSRKPPLAVKTVWILEEVTPYEGSEILGVFVDLALAKKDRPGTWSLTPDGESWYTRPSRSDMEPFYLLTKHSVRVVR